MTDPREPQAPAVEIPWEALERFAKEHGAGQAILVAWKDGAGYCVVTWGESDAESARADDGGNWIKKCLGYPDELCSSIPKKLEARLADVPSAEETRG